ncbi:complement C3-like [Pelodytes ibericus]
MEFGAVCITFLALVICSYAQHPCVLITPNVLRADSDETVIVDAQKISSAFDATIEINDFPLNQRLLSRARITIDKSNGYLGKVNIKIPSQNLVIDPKKKTYVYVNVISQMCKLVKVVLLSFHNGYIFVQTDKTVYTPSSTVLFRIFPTDYKLLPNKKKVDVYLVTPVDIVVYKESFQPEKNLVIETTYKLPEHAPIGTWTISVIYEGTTQNYTTNFEVKEYVLPIFEVKLKPGRSFLYVDDKTFELDITAQYLYGQDVFGMAFVLFGMKKDNVKMAITDSLSSVEIHKGEGKAELDTKHIRAMLPQSAKMTDYRLYVTVTVVTHSGTDMVEAELDDIHIVESPYEIHFTKTAKYYKPGMTFDTLILVTKPDGSPAGGIPVVLEPGTLGGKTGDDDGIAKIKLNTETNTETQKIKVKTQVPNLPPERQAHASLTISAYKSLTSTANYLHISYYIEKTSVYVSFHINNIQKNVKHFTYLIINKGRIIEVGRQPRSSGQNPVSKTFTVTQDFIPSVRLVAYYIVTNGTTHEIVSDSVWIKVTDNCMGKLQLEPRSTSDNMIQTPLGSVNLKLTADYMASVGLVAVDKGVFVLNRKYQITQSKIWDTVERFDIGCTPGSGANSEGVFYDAGLALHTSFKMTTQQRTESMCETHKTRSRRSSVQFIQVKNTKASTYKDLEKQCCVDGMKDNPMGHSCEKRSRFIQEKESCVSAFLDCCNYIKRKREIERQLKEDDDLSRSDIDEEYLPDTDVEVRSYFPESISWKTVQMTNGPDSLNISTKNIQIDLPDSITTWEVLAVSISPRTGVCVAKPYEITVRKNFFIDLRLPYSVARNEQVEIRAVLYNYGNMEITVRVQLSYSIAFCSLSTHKKPYIQEIKIKGLSSVAVPFVIIPIVLGPVEVEVKAIDRREGIADGVRKMLKVVPEGVRRTETLTTVTLNPNGKEQKEKIPALGRKNIVPDTPISTYVTIQGTPISDMLEDAIDGSLLSNLIIQPKGCGEQNMVKMTKCVIATRYLDATGQWDRIHVNRRAEAIGYVQDGVTQQLKYRKDDNAFAIFKSYPSSTWLTAYVVKVFSMAFPLTDIGKGIVCDAVRWLILDRQNPDGLFRDVVPVYEPYMTGGLKTSTDPDCALTAFVLIAMLESKDICKNEVNNLEFSINLVSGYLLNRYQSLKQPYSVAITSYALSLAGKLDNTHVLLSASTDKTHWVEAGAPLITLEATSYALLTLLKMKQHQLTGPIVRWISEQRFYGEPYSSTQATIMMFQALAEYQKNVPPTEEMTLDVRYTLPGRSELSIKRINKYSALMARSEEANVNGDFEVRVSGKGQATFTVTAVYYEFATEAEKECNTFNLSVTVEEDQDAQLPTGVLSALSLNICYRHLKPVPATLSNLDISMMTGFSPDISVLKQLSNGVDKYIADYELNKGLGEKSNLIIYLSKISHTEEECLKIRVFQYFEVGLVQPASVTLFDYYNPQSRCTKFYHLQDNSKLLGKICKEEECSCAAGDCTRQMQVTEEITAQYRLEHACQTGVDYVYKATLLNTGTKDNYNFYEMTIQDIFKTGTDLVKKGEKRHFISHQKCKDNLNLDIGKDYFIWGVSTDLWHHKSSSTYSYMIGKDTWVEWWPTDRECQTEAHRDHCDQYWLVSEQLYEFGCHS